jgi:hypothetical protein
VFYIDQYLPQYFEIEVTVNSDKPTRGWKANAYAIFDYQGPTDFKFAGINVSTDKIELGRRTEEGWIVDEQSNVRIKPNRDYDLLVAVNGVTVTVLVDGKTAFTHVFEPRIIDGWTYGLNTGLVGVGSDNARGRFDNVRVQVLPPELTLDETDDFKQGTSLFTGEFLGAWQVGANRRFLGTPGAGDDLAWTLVDLGLENGLHHASYLELSTTLRTDTTAGLVFDRYSSDDFKFVAIDVQGDQVIVGHSSPRHGLRIDTEVPWTLVAGRDYELQIGMKGASLSVTVDGQAVVGWGFHSGVVDGGFGLFTRDGASSFDSFTVKTNDPAFEVPEGLVAASLAQAPASTQPALSEVELAPLVAEARTRWGESADLSAQTLAQLDRLVIEIVDLEGPLLGQALDGTVWLDVNAAGHGWFVDSTPEDDSEFERQRDGTLLAGSDSDAAGAIDLLSVLTHEFGHLLGLDPHEVLSPELGTGIRVVPTVSEAEAPTLTARAREYAIRVLATEDDDDAEEDWDFAVREIPFDHDRSLHDA